MATIQDTIALNDAFSAPLMSVIHAVNMGVAAMQQLQGTVDAPVDTQGFDSIRDALAEAEAGARQLREQLENIPRQPAPVTWQTPRVTPFVSTGIERFQQEFASANELLGTLYASQVRIAQQAAQTDIFSGSAAQDLSAMTERIGAVQSRIQMLERTPLSLRTAEANTELEQLRGQLDRAVQAQEALNQAVGSMDVQGANAAYSQLSQIIGQAERQVRDNITAQESFNQSVQKGTDSAGHLTQALKRAAAAYVSIQTLGNVLDLSGQMAGTTARLNLMNDGAQETSELLNMIYGAAQNARGSLLDMAAVVAKFGNNARDAFDSSAEVVAFSELVQKQMKIAGASGTEASNAMLQLSQALGSGVLRGDELNSIFEQAPNLIQTIADYLDVPLGSIREMASEGQLTADIVKAAMFDAADKINKKFDAMPQTWEDVWQSFQNSALMAFQPVLQRINELANSEAVQQFMQGAETALAGLAGFALDVVNSIAFGADFITAHWDTIGPVIYGVTAALGAYAVCMGAVKTAEAVSAGIKIALCVASYAHAAATHTQASATAAATAAQYGLNTAMLSSPVTWVVAGIVILTGALVAACAWIAKTTGAAGTFFGVITGGINVAIQFIVQLGLTVANIALGIWNALGACCSNVGTAFHNVITNVKGWFYSLLSTALTVVAGICEALNRLPFVEFDYSGISGKAAEYAAKSAAAYDNTEDYVSVEDAFRKGFDTFEAFSDGWASDAFAAGAAWGDGIVDKVSELFTGDEYDPPAFPSSEMYMDVPSALSDISSDTGAIRDSLDISQEDLKYLRDIAEQEAINRFTTAEIKIEQTNHNNIASNMDLDGIINSLTDAVNEAVAVTAKGAWK